MKRDMSLVRELLLRLEDSPVTLGEINFYEWEGPFFEFEDYEYEDAVEHFRLLIDAGYIDAPEEAQGMMVFGVRGITWKGYEMLDAIRSPEVWKKTKEGIAKVGGVGIDLMLALAKAEGRRLLSQYTGIAL